MNDAETRVARPPGGGRLRWLLGAAALGYVWLGPGVEQVLGLHHPAWRGWQMFRTVGLDATEVRYWQVGADGAVRPLDRDALTAAGVEPPRAGRFTDAEAAGEAARALCRWLGPGADVRFELRDATLAGWETLPGAEIDRCAERRRAR